jgi:pyruvate/2-oxoglutarate dehydrogenase complex dihydrolipoamide acyltransferase (E2) component
MKTIPILMPQMGQSVAEGTIVRWRKKVGDAVAADEVLMEVESDKITVEVESPSAGRLASCLKGEGARAAIGEVVAMLETAPRAPPRRSRPASRRARRAPTDPTRGATATRCWCPPSRTRRRSGGRAACRS